MNQAVVLRIDRLMLAIEQNPFSGVGKPEPLRWNPFKGPWSRFSAVHSYYDNTAAKTDIEW
jgi:Txe/YoeB family toxin of Txe-Axe toxin-antitoxin module